MSSNIAKILIVEDDVDILELLEFSLLNAHYQVLTATDGESAMKKALQFLPDLIILDLMLPKMDGLEVCKQIRSNSETNGTGILMLTAKSQESDVVIGLELGADDYMSKPFSQTELLARIKAILRRSSQPSHTSPSAIQIGPVKIVPDKYEISKHGAPVKLTLSEFRIIHAMAQKPGKVFTREQLLGFLSDQETYVIDRNIDVHIRAIRKKLGDSGALIETIRGIGYKCCDTFYQN
ncbi:MAG: response regulator transcription factor [Zetaproteobacteria bacterium]|nr:response regulator transcription factor [Zetaproteobacteria bacterium]